MRVILDTNFLIECVKRHIDIDSEFAGDDVYTLDSVVKELDKIGSGKTKDAKYARVAKAKPLRTLEAKERSTDSALVAYAGRSYAIATHDKLLRVKIIQKSGKVVYLRKGHVVRE